MVIGVLEIFNFFLLLGFILVILWFLFDRSEEFNMAVIIKETFKIIYNNPILLLPQVLLVIFYYIPSIVLPYIMGINDEYIDINKIFLDFNKYILLSVFSTIFSLFFFIISPIIDAMYPFLIKTIIDGKDVNLKSIFNATWKRIWSIWWASILVGLTVAMGIILLVIPGLIFLTWYSYTIPAMMLGNLGASDGMSASKDFAKNKKLKTILLYLIPFLIGGIGTIISYYFVNIPALGYTVDFGFLLFEFTWMATIPVYAYIKYSQKLPFQQNKTEINMTSINKSLIRDLISLSFSFIILAYSFYLGMLIWGLIIFIQVIILLGIIHILPKKPITYPYLWILSIIIILCSIYLGILFYGIIAGLQIAILWIVPKKPITNPYLWILSIIILLYSFYLGILLWGIIAVFLIATLWLLISLIYRLFKERQTPLIRSEKE